MKTNRIILGLREDAGRMGGYTLETVECEYDEDGKLIGYDNNGFEFLSQDYIDERNDISWADNEKDLWEQAVQGGYTTDSLEDWYEGLMNSGCYDLFPFDDNSYRDEAKELWENLTDEQKEELAEYVGVKDEDFATFNWVHSLSLGNPNEQDWVVVFDNDLLNQIIEKEKKNYEPKTCPRCGKEVPHGKPMYYSHSSEFGGNPLCEDCDKELDKLERLEENNEKCKLIIDYFKKIASTMKNPTIEDVVAEFVEDIDGYTISRIVDDITVA